MSTKGVEFAMTQFECDILVAFVSFFYEAGFKDSSGGNPCDTKARLSELLDALQYDGSVESMLDFLGQAQWRPAADPPTDCNVVLGCEAGNESVWFAVRNMCSWCTFPAGKEITHWRQLPKAYRYPQPETPV